MRAEPRVPREKAPQYAAVVMGFHATSARLRWEDVEDIASAAWYRYWLGWSRGEDDHPNVFKLDVIDAYRQHVGRTKWKRLARSIPSFTDLLPKAKKARVPSIQPEYRNTRVDTIDAWDFIESLATLCSPLFSRMVDLRFTGHSHEEIAEELGCHPHYFHILRRTFRERLKHAV